MKEKKFKAEALSGHKKDAVEVPFDPTKQWASAPSHSAGKCQWLLFRKRHRAALEKVLLAHRRRNPNVSGRCGGRRGENSRATTTGERQNGSCNQSKIEAGVSSHERKMIMAVEVSRSFVDFSLQNQDGKTVTLNDFAGKWLVVYVYPKDDTPGCTIQGKSFTATKQEFDAANIAVVGVSADHVASHKNFCDKFAFAIDLLADPNHELLTAAGVGQSDYKGTMYWNRTSFVVDPAGTLRRIYEKVNPEGHERVLLDDIKAMQAAG
jgi:peroxiredoxin Q/BCP